jgi:SAM-dependent methyltransferase
MPPDPATWALVHDRREDRHFVFWRGLELCAQVCDESLQPGALWADVGSGTGHLSSTLTALGARVVGLDLDLGMARYARRRWSTPLAVADAVSLPLGEGSCSGVAAISLLGCLPIPRTLFAEVSRVLAPGGIFCCSAMNRQSLLLALSMAWGWRRGARTERYTAHTPPSLTAALRSAGLTPVRQIFYGHYLSGRRRVVPSPAVARRWERNVPAGTRSAWARQVLIVARRAGDPVTGVGESPRPRLADVATGRPLGAASPC